MSREMPTPEEIKGIQEVQGTESGLDERGLPIDGSVEVKNINNADKTGPTKQEYDKVPEGINNKETEEKLNQAKDLLLNSFGNIEKTEVRGNYHVQSKETEETLDAIKGALKDPDIDQRALADDFFENTIGKDFTNNRQAYKVYLELKGTKFAQRFKELESARLKKAGFGEFTL
ncbi:MAG: hypothetical protein Q7R89_03860 [bacterium]|nr:hypothetical protein [bacterium]